jgi:hypothetical protein
MEVVAVCIGNMVNLVVTTQKDERQQSVKTVLTKRQQSIN